MGQTEVFDFLKNQRDSGNDKFFSVREIYKGMQTIGTETTTTRHCVSKLLDDGILETDNKWPARVRIKQIRD